MRSVLRLARVPRLLDGLLEYPQLGLVVALIILGAVIGIQNPLFLSEANLIEILRSTVFIFIIGVAATYVFVSGGLDLSVGSVLAMGGIVAAWLLVYRHTSIPLAILAGCGVGALIGLVNGFTITYLGIPALITTLGTLYIGQGLVVVISGGSAILPFPDAFNAIGQGDFLGIPYLVLYAVVIGIAGHLVLTYTRFGYHVRATGGNRDAAKAAGIRIQRISMVVYTTSGLTAGLAGVLLASQLGSGQSSVGGTTELEVIAAVIIGGTSLFGGIGTIVGTVLGALLLSTISDGLVLLTIDPAYQNVIVGFVIVLAVGLDRLRRARMWRRTVTR